LSTGLQLQGIVAGYQGKDILHDISLDLHKHTSLTVVGPNGSGKSTLMKVVVGLLRPRLGKVILNGHDITHLNASQRIKYGIGYVPQEANVFRNMSVLENLKLGLEFSGNRQLRPDDRLAYVLSLFPEIKPKLASLAGHLSGGQRQMVAMAAALMPEPSYLVLDEPSAGLSPRNAELLFQTVRRVLEEGITLLMIEQNTNLGLSFVDEGIVLAGGQIKVRAAASEILANQELRHIYLGA
jgi:ABC-type branched-subunit amino acid transport system ATPase component